MASEERKDFEYILNLVGTTSKLNLLIFVICSLTGFLTSLSTFAYGFLGHTPEFWCYDESIISANWTVDQKRNISLPVGNINLRTSSVINKKCEIYNISFEEISRLSFEDARKSLDKIVSGNNETISCKRRFFNSSIPTTVTDWNLVCDRRWLYSSTQAAIQVGMLLGSTIVGYLVDKLGRKKTFSVCVVLLIIVGFGTVVSPNVEAFIVMRTLSSLFGLGLYMAGFVLCVELSSIKQRSFTGNVISVPWALAIMVLPGIAYFVKPWYYLQLALASPALILLIGIWVLPESPRWLIMNGRYDEAYKVLQRLANSSRRTLPEKFKIIRIFEDINAQVNSDSVEQLSLKERIQKGLKDAVYIIVKKEYRKQTLIVFYCWFSVALVYYGVSLASPDPEGQINEYLYLFLGGLLELIAYLTLWPISLYIGRKKSLFTYYVCCGVSLLAAMIIIIMKQTSNYIVLQWTLYLIGKFAITSAFQLIWLYTAELYPTKYRSLAVGNSSTVGRCGSIFSSYINDLLSPVKSWSPSALFGGFSAVAAFFIIFLPETTSSNLPESIPGDSKKGQVNPALELQE